MSDKYFEYLLGISWKGLVYRRYFLYPCLLKYSNGKILDIGCGTGEFLSKLSNGVGVDINEKCVGYCKRRGLNASLMDEDKLPFPDASFDTIILDNVLEHIADPKPLLGEIRRVLRYKGILIIGVPLKKGYKKDPDHKQYYDAKRLGELNIKNGFEVKRLFEMPFLGLGNILSAACTYSISAKDV